VYTGELVETGAAALLFAFVFLAGGHLHPLRALVRDRRTIISFGAGMSAAYVFVHVIPELHGMRRAFAGSAPWPVRFEGHGIYFLALVGFLVFYGLDHLREHLRGQDAAGETGSAFMVHLGGFAAYVLLMAYLLVRDPEGNRVSTPVFAVAVAFHFMAVDHALRSEHGAVYDRMGRYVLAGTALLGWGLGVLVALPGYVLALAMAFISGAVIMNSALMELPSEKDGRFLPFIAGGVLYGLMLLPLG
jgi:hypothetical protein